MKIKEVWTKPVLDSRNKKTIEVFLRTLDGVFSASAPNGKSRGKFETPPYRSSIKEDTEVLGFKEDRIKNLDFEKFEDLLKLDMVLKNYVGANTLFALQSAILKAVASEQQKQVWELINPEAKKMPLPLVNVIGGGRHSETRKKPDFQEFLIVPNSRKIHKNKEIIEKLYKKLPWKLRWKEKRIFITKNDEGAYNTKLNDADVLEFLDNIKLKKGVDVAASELYHNGFYLYNNDLNVWKRKEQIQHIIKLAKKHDLFYIEDPLQEDDFEGFSEIKKNVKGLVVGDDLTVTNPERLKKAISNNSINGIIVKPNQNGSLIEVKKIVDMAKKYGIKTIMSHRSGESEERILADLSFGFQVDLIKISLGKNRKQKWNRLIEIEKS